MKIKDFIVCDDIRQELGSKITIVGTYNDKIRLQPSPGTIVKWPISLRLGVYLRFEYEPSDSEVDGVDVEILFGGIILAKAAGQLNRRADSNIGVFIFTAPHFPVKSEGPLSFRVDFKVGQKVVRSFEDLDRVEISVDNSVSEQIAPL